MDKITTTTGLFDKISGLIEHARKKVAITINEEMVLLYMERDFLHKIYGIWSSYMILTQFSTHCVENSKD